MKAISIFCYVLFVSSLLVEGRSRFNVSTPLPPARWSPWSHWSLCTNNTVVGTSVRSRKCQGEAGSCSRLPGEDYELRLCSLQHMGLRNQKKDFLNKCMYDPTMNDTLSCKLYREDPAMAYSIFKSTRCLFEPVEEMVEASSAKASNREKRSLLKLYRQYNGLVNSKMLKSSQQTPIPFSGNSTNSSAPPIVSVSSTQASFSVPTIKNLRLKTKFCKGLCRLIVMESSGLSILPTTLKTNTNLLAFLQNNAVSRVNGIALSNQYFSCFKKCKHSEDSYGALLTNLLNRTENQSKDDPNVCAELMDHSEPSAEPMKDGGNDASNSTSNLLERKRRATDGGTLEIIQRPHVLSVDEAKQIMIDVLYARRPGVPRSVVRKDRKRFHRVLSNHPTSAQLRYIMMYMDRESTIKAKRPSKSRGYETKSTRANKVTRIKRKAEGMLDPDRYTSPCFEQTEYSTNPRVLNIDNTVGELYFFEGNQQRFLRRRCAGTVIVPGSLFRPRESVTQTRTGELALCKQGFLKRYGLVIQIDRKGVFAFNNGERFSVKFKPFKLESHCALSTLQ